jgi:SpoVK/Ycf46/Vps4 family AAA+-type ATPase
MDRLLAHFHTLDPETLQALYWLLGPDSSQDCLDKIIALCPGGKRPGRGKRRYHIEDGYDYARCIGELCRGLARAKQPRIIRLFREALGERQAALTYDGKSPLESVFLEIRKMFNLNDVEMELCAFLLAMSVWNEVDGLFDNHLGCTRYAGRHLLPMLIGCTPAQLNQAIAGGLAKIGLLELNHRGSLELDNKIFLFLETLDSTDLKTNFFRLVNEEPVALDLHVIDTSVTEHALSLLRTKPQSATHILLYGPPGTGKTSYAYGLGRKLGMDVYQVEHGGHEAAAGRRAAVTACVNMAAQAEHALIVADDCDTMLATQNSWIQFGESPDRGWLHEILETPGVRMLWTVNSIRHLEESVIRRFAFSINFKPFNRVQRVRLWHNVLRKHKAHCLLGPDEITELATRFEASPGLIDQAVRKAAETRQNSQTKFRDAITLALEANEELAHGGTMPNRRNGRDPDFVLGGLNVKGANLHSLLQELERYDAYLKSCDRGLPITMSLLFHGPSGTGKSHLARQIAHHLKRELVCRRASDLLSPWVGMTEQLIRQAYEEAERKEAVLVFDEADSFLFTRERAQRSWEISFTNEFLTWMESFCGIQIFTTNRLSDLDAASLRRFNYKLEFACLTPEGNMVFYRRLLSPLLRTRMDKQSLSILHGMRRLTPGDFKAVRDRFVFRDKRHVTHSSLLAALRQESDIKAAHTGERSIGFIT